MLRLAAASLLLAAPALAEPVTVGDLTIDRPQLRETPAGAPVAGGYMLVTNGGSEDDTLVAASVDAAPEVEIHEMRMDGDIMRMREVEGGLVIPAGQSVSLQPGGYHLMLMGPDPLAEGEAHEVTLTFENAGEVTVSFAVETLGTIRDGLMPADEMDMDHGTHGGDG
jgi:copper(I)-binding protein